MYVLPLYKMSDQSGLDNYKTSIPFIFQQWQNAVPPLYDGDGLVFKGIRDLVVQWLTTGKFPKEELKGIIMAFYVVNYDYPDHN
jgi:hypothetical protein